eukprot:TRINITY_DN3940_c0_g1_i1.p1 TRINITY_DN3940_c0_g1~~TRINITY_DN3940_c0_g1_i1.p1  ORF type:complete len:369 (-),score=56.19 TRINITY_DN3940_c0_g1_i1:641-1747(-)
MEGKAPTTTYPRGVELQKLVFQLNERASLGGLKWLDQDVLAKQRGVAWDIIKQAGSLLWEGKDLVSVSMPVYIFEPRSFIERLADGFSFAPKFLQKAAEQTDPVERMKWVITFYLAGIHLTATQKKPFNPILGETYQGQFPDGTAVYCEQTTHHPPASNFQVIPPDGSYQLWGYGIFSAAYLGNIIRGVQKGPIHLDFKDGSRIVVPHLPALVFKGLMWGERIQDMDGTIQFIDETNDLIAEMQFNPEAPSWVASWFKTPKYLSDTVIGTISRNSTKEKLSTIEGSWLTHLDFDGARFWTLADDAPCDLVPIDDPLPSDCRYRADLQTLLSGDDDGAQKAKVTLEVKQRTEAKLRAEGRAERGETDHH